MTVIVDYLLGTAEFKVDKNGAENLFSSLPSDTQLSDISVIDGCFHFKAPLFSVKKLKSVLNDCDFEIVGIYGFPKLLNRYKKRWGIIVGSILSIILLMFSTKIIWTFDVSGNELVPDETIVETLKDLGCSYGTIVSSIDFDMLCNDFLVKMPDIAWISVNMDGTHANVEVRETKRGISQTNEINNVIASSDGQIVQITAYGGKKQVSIGDVVRKGDLLISAIGTYGEGYNNIESADGLVLAETTVDFTVEIPLKSEIKVPTGNTKNINSLKIFDFYINLFVNSGIQYEKYDKIVSNDQIELFGVVRLPVWIHRETSAEYYTTEIELDDDEAKIRAIRQYSSKLRDLSKYCEILDIATSHNLTEDSYRICASVHCIYNIAQTVPITIK